MLSAGASRLDGELLLSDTPPDVSVPPAQSAEADRQNVLFASLYDELRQIAEREVRRGAGLALSATTLLHETYFRVQQRPDIAFPDHARRRHAQKRGGGFEITSLPTELPEKTEQVTEAADLERLGSAIDTLAQLDPQLAHLVDLKFFCGYTLEEIGSLRGVSKRTVQRDWEKARLLLQRALQGRDLLPD
jgi:RNA polymerase sigma factor (sigma-70 family)